jgi:hypothetical protein
MIRVTAGHVRALVHTEVQLQLAARVLARIAGQARARELAGVVATAVAPGLAHVVRESGAPRAEGDRVGGAVDPDGRRGDRHAVWLLRAGRRERGLALRPRLALAALRGMNPPGGGIVPARGGGGGL